MRADLIQNVSRFVVKLGTGVLTDSHKQPDLGQMEQLVRQLASQRAAGRQIVVVTSGAVGAGMGALGLARRPADLSQLQACAAVGQTRLMATYEKLFSGHHLHVGQVLLTHDDLQHHERHLNARNTLITLLERGVVPIINENDAVSFEELRFGDNDRLSALVATLLPADLLVVLTTVEGLMEQFGTPQARLVPAVETLDDQVQRLAGGPSHDAAVGGMSAKIMAARIVMRAGIPMIIASGRKPDVLERILNGTEEGTLFRPQARKLKGRKRWIAFFHHPQGTLRVDDGARKALRESGRSLLAPGIVECLGEFGRGDVVRICDANGTEFARGLARHAAREIRDRLRPREEVVHRNDLVIL